MICYKADLDRRYLHLDAWPIEYDRYPGCKFANWASDLEGGVEGVWRPSIHMSRWASRLTLEITGVRVERLDEITEEDANAEGFPAALMSLDGPAYDRAEKAWCRQSRAFDPGTSVATARGAFAVGWDTINGKKYPWASNPWVWCISFRRVDPA